MILERILPSFFIPARKHFFSLQYRHWFLLSLSTTHCLLNLQRGEIHDLKINQSTVLTHNKLNLLQQYIMKCGANCRLLILYIVYQISEKIFLFSYNSSTACLFQTNLASFLAKKKWLRMYLRGFCRPSGLSENAEHR